MSRRLWYGPRNGVWRWYVDNTSASATWERSYAWPPDPMWTESNWPPNTPTVNVFQEESETVGFRGGLSHVAFGHLGVWPFFRPARALPVQGYIAVVSCCTEAVVAALVAVLLAGVCVCMYGRLPAALPLLTAMPRPLGDAAEVALARTNNDAAARVCPRADPNRNAGGWLAGDGGNRPGDVVWHAGVREAPQAPLRHARFWRC